jgi:hypothetical protein
MGSMPAALMQDWMECNLHFNIDGCNVRYTPYTVTVCNLFLDTYGTNPDLWRPWYGTPFYALNVFQNSGCESMNLFRSFDASPSNPNTPITLTPSNLNVSVSYVAAVSASAPVASDQWHTLTTTFKGSIMQVGSAGVVNAGDNSKATINSSPKFAVQISYYARWTIGGSDSFTMGFYDAGGYHEFFINYVSGVYVSILNLIQPLASPNRDILPEQHPSSSPRT